MELRELVALREAGGRLPLLDTETSRWLLAQLLDQAAVAGVAVGLRDACYDKADRHPEYEADWMDAAAAFDELTTRERPTARAERARLGR